MESIPVMLIRNDKTSRSELKSDLENFKFIDIVGEFDDLIEGYNAVIKSKPSIVFIDVSSATTVAVDVIEKINFQLRSCIVYAISSNNDPEFIIQVMKAGASEVVSKPIAQAEITRILNKAKHLLKNNTDSFTEGKIFTVFSNKGGIGKTTIATNLAVSLAEVTRKKVALVDLNLQLGDVTTFLDLSPSYDIAYIVTQISRIDESFLIKTLEKYQDKELYVLADPPYLEQAEEITSEQIGTVLSALRSVFSYIVIDTSSVFDSKTISALDLSDDILLVSIVNLPSIRNAQRCLDLFERLDYPREKVKMLVNRYIENEEISVEDVEDALNHNVYWKIPNNYFTVMSAINRGMPICEINKDSNVNDSFFGLAAKLSNSIYVKGNEQTASKPGSSILANLFGKMNPTKGKK